MQRDRTICSFALNITCANRRIQVFLHLPGTKRLINILEAQVFGYCSSAPAGANNPLSECARMGAEVGLNRPTMASAMPDRLTYTMQGPVSGLSSDWEYS